VKQKLVEELNGLNGLKIFRIIFEVVEIIIVIFYGIQIILSIVDIFIYGYFNPVPPFKSLFLIPLVVLGGLHFIFYYSEKTYYINRSNRLSGFIITWIISIITTIFWVFSRTNPKPLIYFTNAGTTNIWAIVIFFLNPRFIIWISSLVIVEVFRSLLKDEIKFAEERSLQESSRVIKQEDIQGEAVDETIKYEEKEQPPPQIKEQYKYCYNCGTKLNIDDIYCDQCGAKQ